MSCITSFNLKFQIGNIITTFQMDNVDQLPLAVADQDGVGVILVGDNANQLQDAADNEVFPPAPVHVPPPPGPNPDAIQPRLPAPVLQPHPAPGLHPHPAPGLQPHQRAPGPGGYPGQVAPAAGRLPAPAYPAYIEGLNLQVT